ncbi:MAG: ABC-2 family transporter protein [Candidatus Roizmanbacteria bacterium]|nr:ABC-2 family transporter protein [Candidatus Roizmanbacteria bacterium]
MSNNLTLILFWAGGKEQLNYISTYYILMTIGGLFLTSHVEYEVAEVDIKQGELVNYLTKPISYFWINFIGEIPYRVLQAFYATVLIGAFILLFHGNLAITLRPIYIPFVLIIFTLGYFISFTFKMSISYLSFWFKDMRGFYELTTILAIVFSGAVMPLEWYPQGMRAFAQFLPFAYSNYYPVMTFMKPYGPLDFLGIICIQGAWLCALLLVHQYLWKRGIKEFTAVGQ